MRQLRGDPRLPLELRAVKSDVKYIRCQVCQEVAKVLSREASTLRDAKGAKLKESDVLEKVEKVCDPEAVEGEWLITHDLQEKGSELKMVLMKDQYGACGSECKTMQRACEKIVADRDTDVAGACVGARARAHRPRPSLRGMHPHPYIGRSTCT